MSLRSVLRNSLYRSVTRLRGDSEGMVTMKIAFGPCRGFKMRADIVNTKDGGFLWGKYDKPIVDRVTKLVKPGWTAWDCGAYIGYYTLLFSRLVGPEGKVVLFEPDIRNLNRSRQNVEMNGLSNVQFVHAAIGAPLGEVELLLDETTNSHLAGCYIGDEARKAVYNTEDGARKTARVQCISLDEALYSRDLPKPDIIKIDIEGAEKEAIRHMDRVVREVQPLIVLELHNPECDAAAWEFAKRFGYKLYSLLDGFWVEAPKDVGGTVLCCPDGWQSRL